MLYRVIIALDTKLFFFSSRLYLLGCIAWTFIKTRVILMCWHSPPPTSRLPNIFHDCVLLPLLLYELYDLQLITVTLLSQNQKCIYTSFFQTRYKYLFLILDSDTYNLRSIQQSGQSNSCVLVLSARSMEVLIRISVSVQFPCFLLCIQACNSQHGVNASLIRFIKIIGYLKKKNPVKQEP